MKKIKSCMWYHKGRCLAPIWSINGKYPKCKHINCIYKEERRKG